jgi:hypothetical protein
MPEYSRNLTTFKVWTLKLSPVQEVVVQVLKHMYRIKDEKYLVSRRIRVLMGGTGGREDCGSTNMTIAHDP